MKHALMTRVLCAAALAIAGCGQPVQPPARLGLKLPPAALGASISLQQQLRVERAGRVDHLDAALEVDNQNLDMVGLALGQRVMTLHFDGKTLTSWRHAMLPEQVRGEDVLEDVLLTYWPAEAIRSALPQGWRIEDEGLHRTLSLEGKPVIIIEYSGTPRWSGTVALSNLRYGYKLTIQSASLSQ
jgi:hypothetical protein